MFAVSALRINHEFAASEERCMRVTNDLLRLLLASVLCCGFGRTMFLNTTPRLTLIGGTMLQLQRDVAKRQIQLDYYYI